MPLIVKDYKWRQSNTFVIIQIPLHGVSSSKVDVFTSPNYIKASFERYFFEAVLLHPITVSESKCTKTSTEVIFELAKCEEKEWEELEVNLPKKEKLELKLKLIEEEHLRFQEECQKKFERKAELKRVAVREQIGIDTQHRNKIEKIKNEEKTNALGDFQEWHRKVEPKIIELNSDDENDFLIKENSSVKKSDKNEFAKINKIITPTCSVNRRNKIKSTVPMPLPRKSATIRVEFTARSFPTPSRESQLAEEEEWLRKQAEVRRSIGFMSEDLRPEEKNPQYLNSKGQEFLKAGNYLGAISAFSFGIKLCNEYPDLYIGRSEAHFKKENFYKCAQDCSTALDLLRPAVQSNLHQRVTCISRRGMALQKLGYLRESINELEVAFKLNPSDTEIKNILMEYKDQFEKNEQKEKQ
ncbi:hypothetical protein RN001_009128 [Aquatica leii]|uniref:CS domain-containing protein n=1 Tax=Aquatica leii TaxID=1421715 RepID=A0AAN7PV23_9COLE|nr:hypothetical protein RN001_009128 [Aquatica leii]